MGPIADTVLLQQLSLQLLSKLLAAVPTAAGSSSMLALTLRTEHVVSEQLTFLVCSCSNGLVIYLNSCLCLLQLHLLLHLSLAWWWL